MADSGSTVRVPPPVLFAAAWCAQRIFTPHRPATAGSRLASAAILTASGAVAVSAVSALARAGTAIGPEHPEKATTLVTSGPFARSRNPVYLALAGVLVSRAVARRSVAALIPAAGFVAMLDNAQIPAEEVALEALFKRKYSRYRQETPRWARLF